MNQKLFFVICIVLVFASCSKKAQTSQTNQTQLSVIGKKKYKVKESVSSKYNSVITEWVSYQNFEDFLIQNFSEVDSDQALQNSKQLNTLSINLRDSLIPKNIDKVSLKARLNLLHSESFRLYDMSLISAILETEVNTQVQKVFDAFSSVNAKINSMLEQDELEELYKNDIEIVTRKKNISQKEIKPNKPKINKKPKQKNSKRKNTFSVGDVKQARVKQKTTNKVQKKKKNE